MKTFLRLLLLGVVFHTSTFGNSTNDLRSEALDFYAHEQKNLERIEFLQNYYTSEAKKIEMRVSNLNDSIESSKNRLDLERFDELKSERDSLVVISKKLKSSASSLEKKKVELTTKLNQYLLLAQSY